MSGPRPTTRVFRRVVISFHDAAGSQSGLEAAVRFAQMMETELLGLFVEDAPMLAWSAAALTREIGRAAREPVPVTPDRLAADFATAAGLVRQRLARVAAGLGVSAGFQVERTGAAALVVAGTGPGDLLVVVEPADPMARLSYPFADILRAVASASAPVLYIPHRVAQRRGPVVAIAPGPDDIGHRLAAAVAAVLGESLVGVAVPAGETAPAAGPLTVQEVARALGDVRERLLVLSRVVLPERDPCLFAAIAADRMVPTLVAGAGVGPVAGGGDRELP